MSTNTSSVILFSNIYLSFIFEKKIILRDLEANLLTTKSNAHLKLKAYDEISNKILKKTAN
jgi:hypothetical protein